MTGPTIKQVEAAVLAWINELRRQNGLGSIKQIPARDYDEWMPRGYAALRAALSPHLDDKPSAQKQEAQGRR